MPVVVRELTQDDAERARALGSGIFRDPPPALTLHEGLTWFGAFDGDRLVAQAIDREYDSWFGGVTVPTSGIAYVAVDEAYRGQGLVRRVVDAAVQSAVDRRGALISTLYPAAPRVYRGLGYERITDQIFVRVRSEDLAAVPQTAGTSTRPATPADQPAIQGIYGEWAEHQNGPLTRTGPSFTGWTLPDAILAIDAAGRPSGFASYRRDQAGTTVLDLIALYADAWGVLLNHLATLAESELTLRTSGDDPVRLLLPASDWPVVSSTPYMLRVLQIDAALSGRGYPPDITTELDFRVGGSGHHLMVRGGEGHCEPADGTNSRVLTPRGLATVFAGAHSCVDLRSTGHLHGGEKGQDAVWDAVFGGRSVHIRDYF